MAKKEFAIGDFVKVLSKTKVSDRLEELIPIGAICRVTEIEHEKNGSPFYGIVEAPKYGCTYAYAYYSQEELQKGVLKWIPEEA